MDELHRLAAFLYGRAPSSGLVCSNDSGDSTGGGGTPAPPQPAALAPQPPVPTFTPEQLAYIEAEKTKAANGAAAAARRAEQERQRRPGAETQQTQQAPTVRATDTATTANADALALIQLRDDFDDAISDITLDGGQKKFLRGLVMDKRPPDVASFVKDTVALLGLGKSTSTPAHAGDKPAVAPQIAPTGAPVTGNGAPANPTTVTDDTPLLRMTEADREAYRERVGDAKYVERMKREFRNVRVTLRR